MKFYSEFGEDQWIAENLAHLLPAGGFYLDVGCAHPEACSTTAFLRDRGWRGMAIDANPQWAQFWPSDIFVQAIVSDKPIVEFAFVEQATHSRVREGGTRYATAQLWRMLEAVRVGDTELDFLSLDLEGHEFNALMTLRKLPRVIVSEYDTEGIGEDFRVRDHLLELGYRTVHQTRANLIFTRE